MLPHTQDVRIGRLVDRASTVHISRLSPATPLAALVELLTHACGGQCVCAATLAAGRFALLELASPYLAHYAACVLDGVVLHGSALSVCLSSEGLAGGGVDVLVRPVAEGIDALALSHLLSTGLERSQPLPAARLVPGAGCAFVTFPSLLDALRAVDVFSQQRVSFGGSPLAVELARKHEGLATPQALAGVWGSLGGAPLPLALPRLPAPTPGVAPWQAALPGSPEDQLLLAAAGPTLHLDAQFARVLLVEAVVARARAIERGLIAAAMAGAAEAAEAAEEAPAEPG